MRSIFFLLDWIAQPFYILLGVLVAWHFYRLLQARSEMNATYFELERDLATRRQANAITTIVIAAQIAVLLLGVQVRAVPFLEAERDMDAVVEIQDDAPDDVAFATGTPDPSVDGGLNLEVPPPLGVDDDIIVLTPTPTPTPVGTIVPNAPPANCSDPRAFLEVPANGQRVLAPIVVRGIAVAESFSGATLEISGPSTEGQFTVINRINAPVTENSDFSQFSPALYEEGLYQFRLMVFDISTNLIASCEVNIYISEPPSAATPTPGG